MKRYHTSHTEVTDADPEDVWELWSNFGHWPVWDAGIDAVTPRGSFAPGEKFLLTPKGAPEPVEVTLIDVVPHQRFVDETRLPFGTIRASHALRKLDHGTEITHTVDAEIDEGRAAFFERAIWSGMETGVPHSVRNVASLAKQQKERKSRGR